MEGAKQSIQYIFILILFLFVPFFSKAQSNLIINEVYYDTIGDDSKEEFIELYNPLNSSINLEGWMLEDNSSSGEYIFDKLIIASKSYLILARNESGFVNLFGFKPDLTNFNLNLNNNGDYLKLIDDGDHLIDKISWELSPTDCPGVKTGESLERSPFGSDNIIASSQPTPGFGLPLPPVINTFEINLDEIVLDYTLKKTTFFDRLEVYLDKGFGFQLEETYFSLPEKIEVNNLDLATSYMIKLRLIANYRDKKYSFDCQPINFSTEYDYSDEVVINELYPSPKEGEDEFIELYNSSNRSVNLKGWQLADKTKNHYITNSLIIPPKNYLLLTKFQTGLSLNNSGDRIRLVYPDGSISDQISYPTVNKGVSWSKNDKGEFRQTSQPTPGDKNIFNISQGENSQIRKVSIKKALKFNDGQLVWLKGKVSVSRNKFGRQYLYIQDDKAGIQLYFYRANWPNLTIGNKISVVGELSSVRGEKAGNIQLD